MDPSTPTTVHRPIPAALRGALRLSVLAACGLLLAGCPGLRPSPTPMPTRALLDGPDDAGCTVVLLPGMFDSPRSFERRGFAEAARQLAPAVDLVAADAHFGYYRRRSVIDRLHQDVIGPARQDGRKVWLVGVSLGGVGSLLYASEHGDQIEGLLLLAPFLGDDDLIAEIAAAGGAASWRPAEPPEPDDFARRLWLWLQDWHREGGRQPAIHLGYGLADDFAPAGELLGELLAAGQVRTHPAGHDWKAWTHLWQDFLASGALAACKPDSPR